MFSLVVTLRVSPAQLSRFLSAISANAQASVRDEPGCLRFDVCQDLDDSHRFVLYEIYRDQEAFDAHRQAPHFAVWRAEAAECLVPGSQENTRTTLRYSHSDPSPESEAYP